VAVATAVAEQPYQEGDLLLRQSLILLINSIILVRFTWARDFARFLWVELLMKQDETLDEKDCEKQGNKAKVVDAMALFDGRTEIQIRHDGQMYRLRINNRNKLILQK
jgi:hemin uptake protein HemP